jgi:hypothetical protein
MINLDAISRNLFGTGSVSGRSHQSGSSMDMFSSTSSKRKPVPASRSSTMETNRLSYMSVSSEEMSRKRLSAMSAMSGSSAMSISSDERKVPPRSSTSPSSVMSDEEDYVAVSESPYKASAPSDLRQSDVDLHERLQLARKNSKSMAALLPGGPGASRLGTRSVAELRGNVENRERESRLGAKSVPDLKRDEKQQQAEDLLRAACEWHLWLGSRKNHTDPDGFSARWIACAAPGHGTAAIVVQNTVSYQRIANDWGRYSPTTRYWFRRRTRGAAHRSQDANSRCRNAGRLPSPDWYRHVVPTRFSPALTALPTPSRTSLPAASRAPLAWLDGSQEPSVAQHPNPARIRTRTGFSSYPTARSEREWSPCIRRAGDHPPQRRGRGERE